MHLEGNMSGFGDRFTYWGMREGGVKDEAKGSDLCKQVDGRGPAELRSTGGRSKSHFCTEVSEIHSHEDVNRVAGYIS